MGGCGAYLRRPGFKVPLSAWYDLIQSIVQPIQVSEEKMLRTLACCSLLLSLAACKVVDEKNTNAAGGTVAPVTTETEGSSVDSGMSSMGGSSVTEETLELCQDDIDNDNNGFIDCLDFGCKKFLKEINACDTGETDCGDGKDNDNDPYVDCRDRDCSDSPLCEGSLATCSDGKDNDGDAYIDCQDRDCASFVSEIAGCNTGETECADGKDNDNDPYVDCEDKDCQNASNCEASEEACSDGIDNDGDGHIDAEDFDCTDVLAPKENTDALCSDGKDNDENSYTDCKDFSCLKSCDVTVCDTAEAGQCSDGEDNDGNGFTDCDDFQCACAPSCQS